ncbi:MAG TPA: 4-aminobutyrate--2-oxoglutarate transaminase [Vicinamibacterales bacterium]|nr:4-aminobutyrate--2-oxoglutarate transaminase [Vicinamibacterales bacterium]
MTITGTETYTSVAARERHVPRGLSNTHAIFVDRGEGTRVWDTAGKEYLDFTSGIGVLNTGHRHPLVVRAVREQLDRLMHTCFQVTMYEPYVTLAARLSALAGGVDTHKTVLFTTGAEAVENAVKIARAHTRRSAIVAFSGAFHGRSLLALSMTASSPAYRQNFGPFAPEVYRAPYPDDYRGWTTDRAIDALEELFSTEVTPEQIAAVVIEPELGEGGFIPAPAPFMRRLRDLTRAHGIVLVADEVQSGFGRTGRMFGYQHSGIEPDLVVMAKSLAAGLPLSAVTGPAAIMDTPLPGGLGGTYGGNPLACASALAVLDVFETEGLVARAAAIGEQLRAALLRLQARVPQIGDVRGLGAMLAIELVVDPATREPDAGLAQRIIDRARDRGLLLLKCGPHKNVVRLLPPLTASSDEMMSAAARLESAVDDARG